METCLEKVIKLSRTECPCMDTDKPDNYNEGQSEVYLDELEGLNLAILGGGVNCEAGNIWEMMDKARTNATLQFKADILSSLENTYTPKLPNYSGVLGAKLFTSSLSISEDKAGQVVKFRRIVGGFLNVRRIGLIMNATTSIQVRVYNNDENYEDPIASYTIAATANLLNFGNLNEPLKLPLWSKNVSNLEYYFVYTIAGFQPKNNTTECVPCSGGIKNVAWQNWLQIQGIKGSGIDYTSFTRTSEINGLLLEADLFCEAPRVICSDEYPLDFNNSGRAMQIAYAIRFKAGALLVDGILSSPEINRYTMMDREALYGKRNFYRSSYEKWVEYLSTNTLVLNNDCWICRPPNLISKGSILV